MNFLKRSHVEGIRHSGRPQNADVAFLFVDAVTTDDETAAFHLRENILFSNEDSRYFFDLKLVECFEEMKPFFEHFHHLAGLDRAVQKFWLFEHVGKSQKEGSIISRNAREADVGNGL